MGDTGDIVMGMPASDFRTFKENSTGDQIRDYVSAMAFQEYTFIVKARCETNMMAGGEQQIRHYSVKTMPVDYKDQNKQLLRRMELYANKH